MVERLTMWFWSPFTSKEHCEVVTVWMWQAGTSKSQVLSPPVAVFLQLPDFRHPSWNGCRPVFDPGRRVPSVQGCFKSILLEISAIGRAGNEAQDCWYLYAYRQLPYSPNTSLPTNCDLWITWKTKSSLNKLYTTWKSMQRPYDQESFSLPFCSDQATLVFLFSTRIGMSSFTGIEKTS